MIVRGPSNDSSYTFVPVPIDLELVAAQSHAHHGCHERRVELLLGIGRRIKR